MKTKKNKENKFFTKNNYEQHKRNKKKIDKNKEFNFYPSLSPSPLTTTLIC
jgi:hypothetical protein